MTRVMLTRKRLAAMEAVVCLALASDIDGEPDSYNGVSSEDMEGAHKWIMYQRELRGWADEPASGGSASETKKGAQGDA